MGYIKRDNPDASVSVAQRIWNASQQLATFPGMGKPGRVPGTRELVVSDTPFILPYRVVNDRLEILRVLHSSTDAKTKFSQFSQLEGAMNVLTLSDRIRGGLWGLLVGDALGVPYEFRPAAKIPSRDQIEMIPPAGYDREYPFLSPGTWSDDGAQALCLLDSLLANGGLDLADFARRLVAWRNEGLWTADGLVFDVGLQTEAAIAELEAGAPPTEAGRVNPEAKGNGALMRVLPLALWHQGADADLIEAAHQQAQVTHAHVTNQVCCALYCLWARRLLEGLSVESAYQQAVSGLRDYYGTDSVYRKDLEATVKPDDPPVSNGSGYVVATLNAARLALAEDRYEAVVKRAIEFGNDTDTYAAIAGGLAGIVYGVQGIPERWLDLLRGKDLVKRLLEPLVEQSIL